MKTIAFFIIAFFSLNANAQHWETGAIITLHSSIGSRVTPDEKKLFNLFPDYSDSLFEYAQFVRYNDSTYTTLIHTIDSLSVEKPISRTELWAIYYTIELAKPAPPDPAKKSDKYARFLEGLNTATEVLGYTVLWSVKIIYFFIGDH